jgi:hypothetical protein
MTVLWQTVDLLLTFRSCFVFWAMMTITPELIAADCISSSNALMRMQSAGIVTCNNDRNFHSS